MVEHAKAAEAAGFDGLGVSDHFAPWFPDGKASQAWVTLGAMGQVTTKPIGTGVTLRRFESGLEAIDRLWNGETVSMDAGWFRLKGAKLYTLAAQRPKLYVSAFGPQAARIAGRYGDGLWTLGDTEAAPEIIDAYRESCRESGKAEGEIILQAGIAWAEQEEDAIAGARRWKPTQLPELYRDDISDPTEMQRLADEQMTDEQFAKEGFLVGADPDEHVSRIEQMREAGATTVCLQLIGQADPFGTIRTYGDTVLPALRGE